MIIYVDTREQLPYWPPGLSVIYVALTVGDYTTHKLHGRFHVERKSLSDLYSTLLGGHKRFRREMERARSAAIVLVVMVEGTKGDMEARRFPGGENRDVSGLVVVKIANTLGKRHGLRFIWARDRADAKAKTLALLRAKEKEIASRLKDGANSITNLPMSKAKIAAATKAFKAAQKEYVTKAKALDKAGVAAKKAADKLEAANAKLNALTPSED